jgi:hypothetical protein
MLIEGSGYPGVGELQQGRPAAPKNNADSRLMFQLMEAGPKTPSSGCETPAATVVQSCSMSASETGMKLRSILQIDSKARLSID